MVRTLPFHGRNMSSILIGGINFLKYQMDLIILKSFIPESFLSLCILFQLIYNVKMVNNLNYNFPIIDKEVFYQTIFVIASLFFLYYNLKIEGFFPNYLFVNDESTRIIKIFVLLSCFFILSIVLQSFSLQTLNFFEFFIIFLLSLFSLLLLVSSSDLISFYLIIEMQSLCFYILSSFKRDSSFSSEAGLKYFISGAFISGIFLFGCTLLYGTLGTLNFNNLNLLFSFNLDLGHSVFELFVKIGALFITSTLLFKIACAPFHFWSPDVYDGSPLSSTIIFSITPKISLVYFFIKWISCLNLIFFDIENILLFCGIFSAFLGTFYSLSQKRLKKLIIYSSISQIGFIVTGLSLNTLNGHSAVLFFLFIYLITSILIWNHFSLFYLFQHNINSFNNRNSTSLFLSSLTNFFETNKIWAFSFLIIFFSIAGIPPLTGFLAKVLILSEVVNSQNILPAVLLIIISSISVFYYIRVIKILFFEPKISGSYYEKFQIVFFNSFLDYIYLSISFLLFLLLTTFFYPNIFLLFSQYLILNISGF